MKDDLQRDIYANGGGIAAADISLEKMRLWLAARGLDAKYSSMREAAYTWKGAQQMGTYYRCLLKPEAVFPALDSGGQLDDNGNGDLLPANWGRWTCRWQDAIHCSSFYSHANIMNKGLQHGPATKDGVVGIYCFDMSQPGRHRKSVGYAVYSDLFNDGSFWGVMYELKVCRDMAGDENIGKITAGDQWIVKNNKIPRFGSMYHCTAVWYHCLTHDEIAEAKSHFWINFDVFLKDYELSWD